LIFFCSRSSVAPDPHRRQGQPRAIARPSGRIAGVLARGLDTVAHLVLRGARRRGRTGSCIGSADGLVWRSQRRPTAMLQSMRPATGSISGSPCSRPT
jgi:Tfp pilus assembly protein PilP